MKEFFVSDKCPDCREILKDLENNPEKYQDYEFVNITESMPNLKRFLAYRDRLEAFEEVKKEGRVGVPSIVEDGKEVSFPA